MKKALKTLLKPLFVCFFIWVIIDVLLLPQISFYFKQKIENLSQRHSKLPELKIDTLSAKLFPPKLVVKSLNVKPKKQHTEYFESVTIDHIESNLQLVDLLLGRFHIIQIFVSDVIVKLQLDPILYSDSPSQSLPIEQLFEWSEKIPLSNLNLKQIVLDLTSKKNNATAQVLVDHLFLKKAATSLDILTKINLQQYKEFKDLNVETSARLQLTPKDLIIQRLDIQKNQLKISAEGRAKNPSQLTINPSINLRAWTQIPLSELQTEIKTYLPKINIPDLKGTIRAATQIDLRGTSDFKSDIRVDTQSIEIEQFKIGNASLDGVLTPNNLLINSIEIKHPSGQAQLGQINFEFKKPYSFATEVNVQKLDLQKLFLSLNLTKIPVYVSLEGILPCRGQFQPFEVRCNGQAQSPHFMVKDSTSPKSNTIVELENLKASGEVFVNQELVDYKAKLFVDGSEGETTGVIQFDKGFEIQYQTDKLLMKSIKDLASLKFEGQAKISGNTKGNSDTATVDMQIQADNFVFENYQLGKVTTNLSLKKGHLLFENVIQKLGETSSIGTLDIDLNKEQLAGEFAAEPLHTEDLVTVFSRFWTPPILTKSKGHAQVIFHGPLNFWKLNYDLKAKFPNGGFIHTDKFDNLEMNIVSQSGNMEIEKFILRKNDSTLKATGQLNSQQIADLKFDATEWKLENSEFINQIQKGLSGTFNLSSHLKGPILNPDFHVRGSVMDMYIEDTEIPSSYFDLNFYKDYLDGKANLLGNKIQFDVKIPYSENRSNLKIRAKTIDWKFSQLLNLIGANALQGSYDSLLNSEIDLHSADGTWDHLTGTIEVRDLQLKRNEALLKNNEPFDFIFRDGYIDINNLKLTGPQEALVEVTGENFRLSKLKLGLQINSNLRLLHLLVPFLEELGGQLQLKSQVSGHILKPELLGSANIQDGFVKLKGFPHAIERLKSDIVFSHNKIILQSIKGFIAGGTLSGDGNILIQGFKDVPTNVRIQASELNLNVPDRVRSNGNANLLFSGNWFPFVLSGKYFVTSAIVEKEFADDSNDTPATRTSIYLPKVLKQSQFDPVLLDIDVIMNQNVVIRNSLMDGKVVGELKVKGPPQNPILLGKISTEKGSKIIVKDKSFDVLIGNFNFNNPNEVDPDLYLSAQSRVNNYDISVLVQGSSKNPIIRMSSLPPLSDQDIVSLLALGVTSQQLEGQNVSTQQNQLRYEALGMTLNSLGASKLLDKTIGFNMTITSSYDQTKNISVPKLTFTRKLGDRLNATYSRPVSGDSSFQEFKLYYFINNNYSAIGSYEEREATNTSLSDTGFNRSSIFGLDLEFKREFK